MRVKRRAWVALACVGAIMGMATCVRVVEPELKNLKSPSDRRIPLRAGLYLSKELRTRAAAMLQWQRWQIALQNPLLAGFERTLRAAFRDVIEVPSADIDFDREAIDVVVVPEIHRLDFERVGLFGATSLLLVTEWRVTDKNKQLVWGDTISADAVDTCNSKWPGQAGGVCARQLCEDVLHRLFQQALERLLAVEWWRRLGTGESSEMSVRLTYQF